MSRRRLVLATLLMLVALAGCATTPPGGVEDTKEMRVLQARASYERGTAAVDQQQFGLALAAFQEAVQLDPTTAVYAAAMGTLLLHMRQLQAALAWLDRAIELDRSFGDAHFHRGTALAESGRFEEAVAAYRRALLLPTLTVPDAAHQNLGYALYALKRYPEAEASLRYALNIAYQEPAPDEKRKHARAQTHLNLGLVLAAEGRTEEAKVEFRRARELAPGSRSARDAAEKLKALGEGG